MNAYMYLCVLIRICIVFYYHMQSPPMASARVCVYIYIHICVYIHGMYACTYYLYVLIMYHIVLLSSEAAASMQAPLHGYIYAVYVCNRFEQPQTTCSHLPCNHMGLCASIRTYRNYSLRKPSKNNM